MMDKTYILENGILELYLLGELSSQEQMAVARLLASDADLKTKFDLLEETFESMAMENAVVPPKAVKESLMQNVSALKTKVIPLQTKKRWSYTNIAASFLLFALTAASFWMFSRVTNMENELKVVQEEKTELENNLDMLNKDLAKTNEWLKTINNPDTRQYILVGNNLAPNARVISYVNNKDKTVVVNAQDLPELDAKHDYQMWADVDGEMINMGIIDKKTDMLAMSYIENAESLNITIEPAGGNDHPTVSRLVTNIYLNKS